MTYLTEPFLIFLSPWFSLFYLSSTISLSLSLSLSLIHRHTAIWFDLNNYIQRYRFSDVVSRQEHSLSLDTSLYLTPLYQSQTRRLQYPLSIWPTDYNTQSPTDLQTTISIVQLLSHPMSDPSYNLYQSLIVLCIHILPQHAWYWMIRLLLNLQSQIQIGGHGFLLTVLWLFCP